MGANVELSIERGGQAIRQARRRRNLDLVLKQKGIVIGGIILVLMALTALAAPLLTSHDPNLVIPLDRLKRPSAVHFFGTDGQGRDIYSRVLYGGRTSLLVGFGVALVTLIGGTLIGLLAGYYPKVNAVVMRLMDGMMAFPSIILAIGIMAVRGADVSNVILALSIVAVPRLARLVRSVVLGLNDAPFVEAARAGGNTDSRIVWRYILPNCLSPLIVQVSFVFAEAVLGEATLSFLGAGAPPDISSWGTMLSESKAFLQQAPWTMIFPGLALVLTVFALNLLGDGLRDVLDPRLQRRA